MLALFSFSPRLTAVTFAVGSTWFAWRISGSKWLAIVVGGSVAVGVSTCLQWTVLVRTRQRWREASEVVTMVLATLKDDGASSTPRQHPLPINLALLWAVQRSPGRQHPLEPPCTERSHGIGLLEPARLLEAARYMRFATSAYGHALMATFGPRGASFAPSAKAMLGGAEGVDREAICRHCGLDVADLHRLAEGDTECPAHFVAIDRSAGAVVLSVRGTASISDALVHDLVCVAEPFAGGLAHAGMARAALALREQALPLLCQLLLERPGYRLVLTGHSMGAGVAVLLALLLHHERSHSALRTAPTTSPSAAQVRAPVPTAPAAPAAGAAQPAAREAAASAPAAAAAAATNSGAAVLDGSLRSLASGVALPAHAEIQCFAFAPPPVYAPSSAPLPPHVTKSIACYVHHADVVPSLSLTNVRSLLAALRALDASPLSLRHRVDIITGRQPPPSRASLAFGCDELSKAPATAPSLMVPAAAVVSLNHVGRGKYEAVTCSPDAFVARGIELAPSMVVDHAFGFYQVALDALAEDAGRDSSEGDEAAKAV